MNDDSHRKRTVAMLLAITVAAVVGVFLLPRIPQDPAYHVFADQRTIFAIPNFWNVASNLPFVVAGLAGIWLIASRKAIGGLPELRVAYLMFFVGATLTGIGSGWYHLNPSNETLLWDRLPMTIAFMSFLAVVIGEYLSTTVAQRWLWPLLVVGALSVVYWSWTETQGIGDLRPYVLVQFLPGLLVVLILCMCTSPFADTGSISANGYMWGMLVAYSAAKITELLDAPIYAALGGFSGHSIKHLLTATGVVILAAALLYRRRPGHIAVVGSGLTDRYTSANRA